MARMARMARMAWMALLLLLATPGCGDAKRAWGRLRGAADSLELPALLSAELPFHYPPSLFERQVPGDVTLQLHIDSLGRVVVESTRVVEHASHAEFDSAALEGAPRLLFRPARRGESRIGHTVLFPIKFRAPGAPSASRDTARRKP
jgi:TonB family protein